MSASRWSSLFSRPRHNLIGMVHVSPLPGSPKYVANSWQQVLTKATAEARMLDNLGMDGVIVENMGDVPYLLGSKVDALTVSCMAAICDRVREVVAPEKPVGVQILAAANVQAVGVAKACGLQFVRAENFVFAHVADEGLMSEAAAGEVLRFRNHVADAASVAILADVKKKHAAHALTADVDLGQMCEAADFCGADGVVVTGHATGQEAEVADVAAACCKHHSVVVGSGIDEKNIDKYAHLPITAYIVGSSLKFNDHFGNDIDPQRVAGLVKAINRIRGSSEP